MEPRRIVVLFQQRSWKKRERRCRCGPSFFLLLRKFVILRPWFIIEKGGEAIVTHKRLTCGVLVVVVVPRPTILWKWGIPFGYN